jgi:hypothetical protein
MNSGKFASITSSILARKGEAKPWQDPPKKSLGWKDEAAAPLPVFEAVMPAKPPQPVAPAPTLVPAAPPFADVRAAAVRAAPKPCDDVEFSDLSAADPRPYDPEKMKKCTIRMSFIDYERLGIIAVKKNVTRQHLLHEALERCFSLAAEEYKKECACVGNRVSCCQD